MYIIAGYSAGDWIDGAEVNACLYVKGILRKTKENRFLSDIVMELEAVSCCYCPTAGRGCVLWGMQCIGTKPGINQTTSAYGDNS